MNRLPSRALLAVALAGLVACASAPLHYYTLIAPDTVGPAAPVQPISADPASATSNRGGLAFELLPVSVPAQVDQPQLVVRDGEQRMLLLDGERWIAPLGDEVRSALAADLARSLPGHDVSGLPAGTQPRLRIRFDVRRFDSQPGQYAVLGGSWSVREVNGKRTGSDRSLNCNTTVHESVAPGYPALVQGHQRALSQVARQIATAARALSTGGSAVCPAS